MRNFSITHLRNYENWLTHHPPLCHNAPIISIDSQHTLHRYLNGKEVVLMDSYLSNSTVALPPRES